MLDKLAKILFSTRLTAILFIAFAAAMATGTFMDAGQDTSPTPYSRNLIYNTWWFEAIMGLFVVNFVGNIFRYRLYKKEKWATLILHLSFIFILLGAGITRYISFEGMMAIREGTTENTFLSQKTYITGRIHGDYQINGVSQMRVIEEEVDFSPRLDNDFSLETEYNGQPVTIELEKFIGGAEEDIIPDANGESYLKVVEAGASGPHNHFLKVGQVSSIHNILFALNKPTPGAINITYAGDSLTINSPFEGEYMTMATRAQGKLVKDSLQPLYLRSRYVIGNMQMVFPKPVTKGVFDIVKKSKILKNDDDGVVLTITSNGETKRLGLLGGKGRSSNYKKVAVGGLEFEFRYGSKFLELPFAVKLNDFEAERYPGTEKGYSAYSSEVTVVDEQEGSYDYKIYMNNILDHRGYRFFQSGFDPDEKGTILSVSHDYWGTLITYIGYILLYFGLMAILFAKGTRFWDLKKRLENVKAKKEKLLAILVLCFGLFGFAQSEQHSSDDGHNHTAEFQKPTKNQIDSILKANIAPKDHANKFSRMVIQDLNGRMKPVNTYASELLRKISHRNVYEEFNANQVFLSMQESPRLWYNVPIIYLKPLETDSLRTIAGIPKSGSRFALVDFLNDDGSYKLSPYLDEAYNTTIPNGYEKKLRETHERITLLSNALEGLSLKIFPIPNDDNNKWISNYEYRLDPTKIKDSLYSNFVKNGFRAYLFTLNEAKQTGDFTEATKLLEAFKKTQHKYGSEVMLSDKKIDAEIAYINLGLFKKLSYYYFTVGFVMFVFLIFQIFYYKSKFINIMVNICKWSVVVLFILHIAGLVTRWYISGHAPWTDTYETMLYVAWSVMFFGLFTGVSVIKKQPKPYLENINYASILPLSLKFEVKTSDLTIASSAFVASIILVFAHMNWLDPSIANLQPVLNSYWIMIHVSIIVASYGPFALGLILGVVSLLLMAITTEKHKAKIDLNIKELTVINEMALTVGLVMLTIGNFLGGMWANESWGRYWGWDPKETWALISIMVYTFVIHMRLVPGLRGRWLFNWLSIFAFASIMMTYFGVNFYLAGLHSYASGDQIVSLKFIGIAALIWVILGAFAYRGYAKFYKK
ncbi:cytochrome c biogenesis protein CcsA [Hyunsoonleella pacifica]|uniref:Cytochrome C biogenesis protein n=1 Tax=Hyunsoonleella pacifica TaxID=1080224 RepID=A0A4Q9FTP9_9FLAO|nr:cytochrome c biogenesis protein CcsA [Hyunsoonleella pacifica]TBN19050.1 cytochrome C biogenesis protein [Hyunsoonleella pacifica]GGD06926.1 cytochrome c biogenesis protein [Hyunsoonleella pacifica]